MSTAARRTQEGEGRRSTWWGTALSMNHVRSSSRRLQREERTRGLPPLLLLCQSPLPLFSLSFLVLKKNYNFNIILNRWYIHDSKFQRYRKWSLPPIHLCSLPEGTNIRVTRYPSRNIANIAKQLCMKSPSPITNGKNDPSPHLAQMVIYSTHWSTRDFMFCILEKIPHRCIKNIRAERPDGSVG